MAKSSGVHAAKAGAATNADACIAQGNTAFVYDDYETAVAMYSKALEMDPLNAQAHVLRSHANIQLGNFLEASQDATKALELDSNARGANLRKGIANFYLEEYESALDALTLATQQGNARTAQIWAAKCNAELADEHADEDAAEKATKPSAATTNGAVHPAKLPASNLSTSATHGTPAAQDLPPSNAAVAPCALPPPAKYRLEWFQGPEAVEVAILAKGLVKEQVHVDITTDRLVIRITDAQDSTEELYTMDVLLHAPVDAVASRWTLLSTKVEVTLKKSSAGHWSALDKGVSTPASPGGAAEISKPQYPTSGRRKVDWQQLDQQIDQELEDEQEGDPLTHLFRSIYSKADEDTRRAMNKSFQESGGTVLSTNWKEVGTGKVQHESPSAAHEGGDT